MNIVRIHEILLDCHEHVDEGQNPPPGTEIVDVYLGVPLKVAKVHEHAAEMIELLKEWPDQSWGKPVPPLGEEINYITAGGILDSQNHAFMFFAFGKLLGWWSILDPHTVLGLDKDDPVGRQMAASGMIAITGFEPRLAS